MIDLGCCRYDRPLCYHVTMTAPRESLARAARKQRAGVEDRWRKRDGTPSAVDGQVTRWRARYVDDAGREHTRAFDRKVDAQRWLAGVSASIVRGDYIDPKLARMTVDAWCELWLSGYRTRRKSTVRQAEVHLKIIKQAFGVMPLSAVKPSQVKAWTSQLKAEGRADSYVYALHSRLSQLMNDAVHDGVSAQPLLTTDLARHRFAAALRRKHRAGMGSS